MKKTEMMTLDFQHDITYILGDKTPLQQLALEIT